ncbi:MAG: TonB family protein [Pseudomonadota bacterium]
MNEEDEDSKLKNLLPVFGGIGVLLVFGALGYAAINSLGGTAPPEPPAIQEISLIQPPPPPPPPPKMEEPPPPEMEEVEVPEPEPEPIADDSSPDEPLPGDELGLDADGVAGADGFGLKAKKGGRGLIGGGDPNKWYAGVIQSDLQDWLADIDEIRKGRYAAIVKIWINNDGAVQEAQLVQGTGDSGLDSAIERALSAGFRISRAPPAEMPQPVKLRITSRT